MMPQYVSYKPSASVKRNTGSKSTWKGSIMPPMNRKKMSLFPLNRKRARAYAAREDRSSVMIRAGIVMMKLFGK